VLLEKELLDVVRDRRTLLLTVGLPVLLYPAMMLLMGVLIGAGTARLKNELLTVAVVGAPAMGLLGQTPTPAKTTYAAMSRDEAEAALKDKKVDAPDDLEARLKDGRQVIVTVLYTKRFDRSIEALDRLRPALERVNAQVLKVRLDDLQLAPEFVQPVKADVVDLEFKKDIGAIVASRILPVVLLMMLILGALLPAVDLTAGEKERGTLETLLVCAVRPFDVMAAKYLTVSLVAVMTALANLGAMAATFGFGFSFAASQTITFTLSFAQVGIMLACLVPAALLLSGLAVAVSATARTFKEGQALMTPVMLVCLAPAMISLMPGMELTAVTALIPLLNVSLLVKAAVLGTATPVQVMLTAGSVLVFAGLGLKLAASAFNSEVFRFAGTRGWGALFGAKTQASKQSDHR
jgi:sodium transport system permease protein